MSLPAVDAPIEEIKLAGLEVATAGLVLYVEAQPNIPDLLEIIPRRARPTVQFYVPSIRELRETRAALEQQGMEDQLLEYWTVDPVADVALYEAGRSIAREVVAAMKEASGRFLPDPELYVNDVTELALETVLMDRIVKLIRPFHLFAEHEQAWRDKEVVLVARRGYTSPKIVELLAEILGYRPRVALDLMPESWQRRYRAGTRAVPPPVRTSFTTWPLYDAPSRLEPGGLLLLTNLADLQNRRTVWPIMRALGLRWPVTTISVGSETADPGLPGTGMYGRLPPRVSVTERNPMPTEQQTRTLTEAESRMIAATLERAAAAIAKRPEWNGRASSVIESYLTPTLGRIITTASDLMTYFASLVATARAVVLLPARSMESQILLRLAAKLGIQTIEVQSGTIAPNPRFIPPTADWVLAMEEFSRDVYCDFHGRDPGSVEIVGSPKIDAMVEPLRGVSRLEARRRNDLAESARIVLFATQPLGLTRASQVMEMVTAAVNGLPGAHLVVKLHPNEGVEYEHAYREVARQIGLRRFRIERDAATNELVVAADAVITVYSTVGLEAFVLARPVVVANPFGERPAYDLRSLGVAEEAADEATLRQMLEAAFSGRLRPDGAANLRLRDGRSLDRIVEFVERIS